MKEYKRLVEEEKKCIKYFVNLTNGIEAIPNIPKDYSFIRIQSTACEQKL